MTLENLIIITHSSNFRREVTSDYSVFRAEYSSHLGEPRGGVRIQ